METNRSGNKETLLFQNTKITGVHFSNKILFILITSVISFFLCWHFYRNFVLQTSRPNATPFSDFRSQIPFKVIEDYKFDQKAALKGWRDYALTKKSHYEIGKTETGEVALKASSQNTSSAIFKVVNISIDEHPVMVWEWKVTKFPTGKTNRVFGESSESDYAARVTAVFGKQNPFNTQMIQYIWDDHFPVGTFANNSYSKNVKMLVVRSGPYSPEMGWVKEERDLIKDYEMLFGKVPANNLRGISIMTDSDDTNTSTEAYVKRLTVGKYQSKIESEKVNVHRKRGVFRQVTSIWNNVRNNVRRLIFR